MPDASSPSLPTPPRSVRAAGVLTGLEGLVALVIAAVLLVRGLTGSGDGVVSGYGIAAWFAALGAGVLAAGVALVRGRRGGRAPSTIVQAVLLPVTWSLVSDSGQPVLGAVLGVVVVAVLVLLFAPSSVAWTSERFAEEHPPVADGPAPPLTPGAQRTRRGDGGAGR